MKIYVDRFKIEIVLVKSNINIINSNQEKRVTKSKSPTIYI